MRASARSAANFYLGHTPRLLRLKYSGDQPERRGTNPGSKSPSCVSHRLRQTNHVAIPSYREESPWHVRRFRTAIVSRSGCCGFRGTERGSIPLPTHGNLSPLGSVFRPAYRQALTGLYMVELFTAVAFDDGPRTGQSGSACCQARSSPRRPGCTKFSRTPEPPGRDYAMRSQEPTTSPALCDDGPNQHVLNQACPHRPRSCAGRFIASDRTSGLLVSHTKRAGLL